MLSAAIDRCSELNGMRSAPASQSTSPASSVCVLDVDGITMNTSALESTGQSLVGCWAKAPRQAEKSSSHCAVGTERSALSGFQQLPSAVASSYSSRSNQRAAHTVLYHARSSLHADAELAADCQVKAPRTAQTLHDEWLQLEQLDDYAQLGAVADAALQLVWSASSRGHLPTAW